MEKLKLLAIILLIVTGLASILKSEELNVRDKYTYDVVSGFCQCYTSNVRIYIVDGKPEGKYVYSRLVNECGVGYKSRYSCTITNIKLKEEK